MFNALLDALGVAGNVIDTPGAVARGLLAGNTEAAFGGIMDPSKRISGRGLLENYGVVNAKQDGETGFDFADALGMGADILTNPLTYVGGAGIGTRALRGAGQAAEVVGEAASPLSGMLNARRGFSMAKDVIPGKIPERLVGGGLIEKSNAATGAAKALQSRAIEQIKTPGSALTQAIYDPAIDAGAVLKGAGSNAARHEVVHGMTHQAYKTGEMAGLPLPVKLSAKIMRAGGGGDPSFLNGLGYAADELTAHSLENRGLLNQLKGAGQFLFSPGKNHDFYAREFGSQSPLVGAIYGGLPSAARGAGYGAAGLGGLGVLGGGAYGIYAYGMDPEEER